MKRHPSLVPLSHDHHHALVEARRLRRAADFAAAERRRAAATFLRFFSTETIGSSVRQRSALGSGDGRSQCDAFAWPAGRGANEHVNSERDVMIVVLAGSATVTIEDEAHGVHAGDALVVEKGQRRSISTGPGGVRYLSVHRRRGPLQIATRGDTRAWR